MKTAWFSLILLYLTIPAFAGIKTVIGNASNGWSTASNWSPAGVPANGDIVVVPFGRNISVKGNIYTTPSQLTIQIAGSLDFEPSGKLDLSNLSTIQILSGGQITSHNNNSEVIWIGGITKYQGGTDVSPLVGPVYSSYYTGISPEGFLIGTVLPVRLAKFSGNALHDAAQLNWSTSDESGLRHFIIEKSVEGSSWHSIKSVAGKGAGSKYSVTDKCGTGTYYYRVKMVALDGTTSCSNMVRIQVKKELQVVVAPNPAADRLHLILPPGSGSYLQLQLRNLNGQLVKEQIALPVSGRAAMDLTGLKKGVYNLQVLQEGQPVTSRKITIN